MSILIVIVLVAGFLTGTVMPENFTEFFSKASSVLLFLMVLFVGMDIGLNKDILGKIKGMGAKILCLPAAVILGSIAGGALCSLFMPESLGQCMSVTAGMGWYSLSGALITDAGYPVLGAVSFLTNVIREVTAIIIIPVVAKRLNFYCAIAPAGATAMDTALPAISRATNGKFAMIAFICGLLCSMPVVILVPFFLNLSF